MVTCRPLPTIRHWVRITQIPVWHMPLHAEPLYSTNNVLSGPKYLYVTIIAFEAPKGTLPGDHSLKADAQERWVPCDHRIGANKSELELKHGLSPRLRTRMIDNLPLIRSIGTGGNVICMSPML